MIGAKVFIESTEFSKILKLQNQLREDRINNNIPDTLLILQHLPVMTIGLKNTMKDFLKDPEELQLQRIDIEKIKRGGGKKS
jgi:lipoyl(octanoyl) transferase